MKRGSILLPLVGLALVLGGCGGSDTTGLVGNQNPRIRVLNDFSDVSSVSATVDTKTLLTSQGFGMSSAYTIIDNGNRTITFNDVSGAGSIPMATRTELLEENHYYTAIGVGDGPAGRRIILLDDSENINANMTKVRFVNADQDHASVDVYFTTTSTPDLTGETPLISGMAYGDETSVYTDFTPGTYKVWVTPQGSLTPITAPNLTFTVNTAITLVVVETPTGYAIQTLSDRPLPGGTP